MGFAGRFELTVPDILQILSLSRKTGKLTLSRLGNSAELLFKNGMVTFATCDSTRHTLSSILISQKRVTESALMAALELQHLSSDNKRLGAILIEKGIITHRVLQEAFRYQIEQVMSELLTWENGFFRFDMIEVATDDGVTIDVGEFLGKAGVRPALLFLDGTHRLDDRREAEMPRLLAPEPPARPERSERDPRPETPASSVEPLGSKDLGELGRAAQTSAAEPLSRRPRPEQFDVAHRPEPIEGHVEGARPEPLGPARGKPVEGPAERPRSRPEVIADLIEGQWQGERPPWIKPEPTPDPAPTMRIEEHRQVVTPRPERIEGPRPEPLDPARDKRVEWLVEGPHPPLPEPQFRLAPEAPLRPTPEVPRPKPVDSPGDKSFDSARDKPPVLVPPFTSQTSPVVPAAEAQQRVTRAAKEPQIPASPAPSGTSPERPLLDFEPSRITDEIMLSSPIAPWVLVMHLAADVVSRGVLLFVRSDGITGHDQFGVGGGRESGDERVINLKIPWNEPSILAATIHARTTYRGKIGPGKWNEYFLGQLGGQRPNEAVIIPIIVAGKVVAIFYGDDAGTATPLGDVQRLQTLIGQTFSAVEASILEKRGKTAG